MYIMHEVYPSSRHCTRKKSPRRRIFSNRHATNLCEHNVCRVRVSCIRPFYVDPDPSTSLRVKSPAVAVTSRRISPRDA